MRKTIAGVTLAAVAGCGPAGMTPAYTPQQVQEIRQKEIAGELVELERMEKKFGANHPEVKQRRIELGVDPMPQAPGAAK